MSNTLLVVLLLVLVAILYLCWFLIRFLMETDTKYSYGCHPLLVVVSCSILKEIEYQLLFWLPSSACDGL